MIYEKTQDNVDKSHKIFRVKGIGFENGASDKKIEKVVSEVFTMETMAPGLMTAKALYNYLGCLDEYILERMISMPIGNSFNYEGLKITRWSENTYNGKKL